MVSPYEQHTKVGLGMIQTWYRVQTYQSSWKDQRMNLRSEYYHDIKIRTLFLDYVFTYGQAPMYHCNFRAGAKKGIQRTSKLIIADHPYCCLHFKLRFIFSFMYLFTCDFSIQEAWLHTTTSMFHPFSSWNICSFNYDTSASRLYVTKNHTLLLNESFSSPFLSLVLRSVLRRYDSSSTHWCCW